MDADGPGMLALAVLVGVGATLATDLWALLLRAFGVASLDWSLVGRWIGHWFRGRFVHERIALAAPMTGERALGWSFHYAVGMIFALALLVAMGPQWAARPTLLPCLITGWATAVFPFFVMQPALGAGIAASRTPQPWNARMKSLLTHTVFGLGLYLTLRAIAALAPAG